MKEQVYPRDEAIKAIAAGKELAELRGINEATIDFIYAFSALHYKNGNYDDAIIGFRFLCRHKHRDGDIWLALARALFAKGEHTEALRAYLMVAVLQPTTALCLEIARAFFTQGLLPQAKVFLEAATRTLAAEPNKELEQDILALEKEVAQ